MQIQWWVTFPKHWKLEDVQAGLVVCISLLAFIAVFTSARCFWHSSAKRISKNADVPISSLLSFTTLGEVLDVIILLKTKLFSSKHFALTFQCLLVVAFSACAIFAGPISRYATKRGLQDGLVLNKGLIASQSLMCDVNDAIRWHNVSQSLDNALFPYDQLLDFLPDTNSDWVYHADDWNSTWSAKCSITTEANITLVAVGNYTDSDLSDWDNIPDLKDVLSARYTNSPNNSWYSLSRTGVMSATKFTSLNYYTYAEYRPGGWPRGYTNWASGNTTQQISIHLSSIAMLNVPRYNSTSDLIAKGTIPNAWYTKVECDLTRKIPAGQIYYWQATVDQNDCNVAQNMDDFFTAQSVFPQPDQSVQVQLPTGSQLWRFFQAYSITKDTHYPWHVNRLINQRIPTVQISTVFIGVMSLIAVIVLFGLLYCLICRIKYSDLYKRVPETKVDWLLQSLREAQGSGFGGGQAQSLASPIMGGGQYSPTNEKEKMPWEKARYSLSNPHHSPSISSGYSSPTNTYTGLGLGKVSIDGTNNPISHAPPSLVPGQTSPFSTPFSTFVNRNNGYSPLVTPQPYTGASPVPSFTSPPMSPPMHMERVVSYGMNGARGPPIVSVTPRTEKGEWDVGVVETRP